MSSFKIKVVTHTRKVVEQKADFLRVRTTEGDLGILPKHSPLVAELVMSKMEIEYDHKQKRDAYFISGGFLEISNNEITIIADDVLRLDEIVLGDEKKNLELLKEQADDSKKDYLLGQKIKETEMKIALKESTTK